MTNPKTQLPDDDLNKDPTSKSEAKQMMKEEDKAARKEHSKSGANTGKEQENCYCPPCVLRLKPYGNCILAHL
ncbi:hypothetical protein QBC46DRAFT_343415 [Diplogelasinospora grovesii]|uniref:Uncharacterized protein n=1 Tax=Diplogelasinospora grovesii TaxID=303347 RepID=A0AAN6N5I2_9PEZI|nr:hypothetical protein QBC46DRAFT_343415 [Diplogelasinospora grovesii]